MRHVVITSLVGLVLPKLLNLGNYATINMDAVSIAMSFMIAFFANACGVDLSFGLLAIVLLSDLACSVAMKETVKLDRHASAETTAKAE